MFRLSRPFLCLTIFLLGSGCAADDTLGSDGGDGTAGDTSTTSDTGTADTGEEMTGQELYTSFCSACHGPEGEGTNIAYELHHPHDEFTRWVVRNGRMSIEFANQTMPQFTADVLSDAELDRIIEYLDGFPQPTTPEGLYLDYCRNCHGIDAAGGVVNAPLMNSPIQDYIENVRQGRGGTNYGARAVYMPARTADELSDAEIQEIFDYVGTL
jgi:mono/diheme cytochrome c family protein